MREDPLPNTDPNEKFYRGDNEHRHSGQALELKLLNIDFQAAPSQSELLLRNHMLIEEKLKSKRKEAILAKYGNAAKTSTSAVPLNVFDLTRPDKLHEKYHWS